MILLTFFITSVGLSRVGRAEKRELVDVGKTGPRDAWQVLANGGAATVCIVLWRLIGGPDPVLWFVAFAGAYAAATADTWGTEIGTLGGGTPRDVLTGKPLAAGLSGGVTAIGTLAEALGALLLGLLTWPALLLSILAVDPHPGLTLFALPRPHWSDNAITVFALPVVLGGMLGAIIDSVLGATLQERRWCPRCRRECETDPHHCGTPTERQRGIAGFSNDAVNAVATVSGALVAGLAWLAEVAL